MHWREPWGDILKTVLSFVLGRVKFISSFSSPPASFLAAASFFLLFTILEKRQKKHPQKKALLQYNSRSWYTQIAQYNKYL